MKKLFTILSVLISAICFSQVRPTQPLGTKVNEILVLDVLRADTGILVTRYPDTATANLGYIKIRPGAFIRTAADRIFMRNDAASKWLELAYAADIVSAPDIIATNGLTESPSNTIKLGGLLTENTTISSNGFNLSVNGSVAAGMFGVNQSHATANGITSLAIAGTGVQGQATTGIGVWGTSTSGIGGQFSINPSTTTTAGEVVRVIANSSGAVAAGFGGSINFRLETSNTSAQVSNTISSVWTNVTTGSQTSQLIFAGMNSATLTNIVTLSGNGAAKLNQYVAVGSFPGTAVGILGFDASGNILTMATPTGGGGSQTLQQTIDVGDFLSHNNKIKSSFSTLAFSSTGSTYQWGTGNDSSFSGNYSFMRWTSDGLTTDAVNGTKDVQINSSVASSQLSLSAQDAGNVGFVYIAKDKITLGQTTGIYQFDNVAATTDTSTYKPFVIDLTGKVKKSQYWYGGSGGSAGTQTLQQTFNTEVGGSQLTKIDTIITSTNGRLFITGSNSSGTVGIVNIQNTNASGTAITTNGNLGFGAYLTAGAGKTALQADATTTGNVAVFNGETGIGVTSRMDGTPTGGLPYWGILMTREAASTGLKQIAHFDRTMASGSTTHYAGMYIGFDVQRIDNGTGDIVRLGFRNRINTSSTVNQSEFMVMNRNNSTLDTTLRVLGGGQVRLDKYGVNTFTGTPAYDIGVDGSGNLVEFPVPSGGGGGYTLITQFVDETAWRVYYSNASGDMTPQALGASGTVWTSNGASSAPTWSTPADVSATNELQTYAHSGTTSYTNTLSNSGGSFTLQASGTVTISHSAGTVTFTGTGLTSEVDGSVTNELQTLANTSTATTHTVTLSNSGGSIQLAEGSGITLTTTGTGLDGVVTIAASGVGYTTEQVQDDVGAMINASLQYVDATPLLAINDRDFGDITTTGSGLTWTVDAAAITYAKIQNGTGLSVLGRAPNTAGVNADIIAANDNEVLRRSGTSIGFGAINLASASAVTGDLPFSNLVQGAANTVVTNPTAALADFTTTALAASNLLGRGSTGNIAPITVGGILSFSGTVLSATEVDGSVSNELQTFTNASTATTHTVTLSSTGGSFQLAEGTGITLTTTGTAADGVITIASTGGFTTEDAQDAIGLMINASLQYVDATPLLAINDRDFGDITTTGSGLTMTIDNNVVTFAKMVQGAANTVVTNPTNATANFTTTALAANNLLGRGSTGDIAPITVSGLSFVGTVLTAADASATNELQTLASTSDATSHTVTLSSTGGSFKLVEGTNITLTTTGTGADGIITIASTGGGGTPATPFNSVQYNNAGAFGGSANLLYDAALLTSLSAGLGVTQDDAKGIVLINTTTAAAGAQQISPAVRYSGQGWKTTATAASQEVEFRTYVLPVQGANTPNGAYVLESSIGGGSYSTLWKHFNENRIEWGTGTTRAGDSYSLAMNGSTALNVGAIVFSQNAIDSGSNTFMGAGQNTVIRTGTVGTASFMTDGVIYGTADYGFAEGDANKLKGYTGHVGGFGSENHVEYGFVHGLNIYLGALSSGGGTGNQYTEGFGIGARIASTGSRVGLLGFDLTNSGVSDVINIGANFTNSTANTINLGTGASVPTLILRAGTGSTPGMTDVRGTLAIGSVANDDAETKLLVWNSAGSALEYRTVASLPGGGGGSGTVNSGVTGKPAYYVSATTLDDFTPIDYALSGTHALITAQAATDVPLNIKAATSQTANVFNISSSVATGDLLNMNSAGEVLINNATSNGYKLNVNGAIYATSGITNVWNTTGYVNQFYAKSTAAGNAYAAYSLENNATELAQLFLTSSSFSAVPFLGASALGFNSGGAGGIAISAYGSTGSIRFSTGVSFIERFSIETDGSIRVPEQSAPTAPIGGYAVIYPKTDGLWYGKDDAGVETKLSNVAGGGGGYTTLSEFIDETAWRMFYSNASGDVTPFALGTSGQVLTSNGASAAPSWTTIAGTRFGVTGEDNTAAQDRLFNISDHFFEMQSVVDGVVLMGLGHVTSTGAGTYYLNIGAASKYGYIELNTNGGGTPVVYTKIGINTSTPTVDANEIDFRAGSVNVVLGTSSVLTISNLDEATGTKTLRYDPTTDIVSYYDIPAGGSGSTAISALTIATVDNTINNANYRQEWQWNTLGTSANGSNGTALLLTSSAASTVGNQMLLISKAGTNATGIESTGIDVAVTSTGGTSTTNTGLKVSTSGATTNNAIYLQQGDLRLGGGSAIQIMGSSTGVITITRLATSGTYTLTLPNSDGNTDEFLKTDGSGGLSWAIPAGGAGGITIGTTTITGGTSTRVLYNNAGVVGEYIAAVPATASSLVLRDANTNLFSNNSIEGYTTTATAGTTTVLTVSSAFNQFFTGSSNQTITLPLASSLTQGQTWNIVNGSSGTITINSSGGNQVAVLAGFTTAMVTCIVNSGTSATSWFPIYNPVNATSGKRVTFGNTITFNGTDGTTMTFPSANATIAATNIAQTWTAGIKPSFDADATSADIRLIGNAGDPSTLSNGDMWYNSTTNRFMIRANGVTRRVAQTLAKAITMQSPTTSENATIFYTTDAITVEEVRGVLLGTSAPAVTFVINYGDTRDAADGTIVASINFDSGETGFATTGFAFTINTSSIPAGNYVWLTTSATAGTINDFNITISYRQ